MLPSHSTRLAVRSRLHPVALAAALLTTGMLLSACGGSDDGGDAGAEAVPEVPTTVAQAVKVIDGPIRGATVCLDKNSNGLCDEGEPKATTAADGSATLTIASADANKYPVLALVSTDAVDADNGPVTVAYSLTAPADKPAVVSPLSTLVAAHAAAANLNTAAAEQAVQEMLSLSVSPLADFSASTTAAGATASATARLLVLATQQQITATADAKAADGSPLAKADVAKAIQQNLLTLLPTVANAVADNAVTSAANAADKAKALAAAAAALTASDGLTATSVAAVVAPGLTLRWLSYTDAGTYSFRAFKATAAQATVANGKFKFTEYREQAHANSSGTNTFYQQWGEGLNNWARNQMVWTGSAWFACPTEHVHEATAFDASGRSDSSYCNGAYKSANVRSARDISGKTMADIVKEIRAYPLKDSEGDFAAWGPDPVVHASKLTATFPAGSKLFYYSGTDLANPDAYNTGNSDDVFLYNALVAGGNTTECNKIGSGTNLLQFQDNASPTLEKMVARLTGTPCVYQPRSTPTGTVPNEWWTQSTLSIGTIFTNYADTSGSAYFADGTQSLRLSFGSGNAVNYWLCLLRNSDGSIRNCQSAGTGSYTIESLGNARVMRFANMPALANNLSYVRTVVEHNGQLWHGYRGKLRNSKQLRPNLEATNALFSALGIPAPKTGATLTADSLLRDYTTQQGRISVGGVGIYSAGALAWMPNDNASLVGAWSASSVGSPAAQTFFFFADGSYVMTDPVGDVSPTSCGGIGFEKGTYRYDTGTKAFRGLSSTLDTNGCAGLHDTTNPVNSGFGNGGTLTLSADGKQLVFSDAEGSTTLFRLTK